MSLSAGYQLSTSASEQGEELRLHAPDGRICIKITLTPEGPLVELASVALSVAAQGKIKVACESFEVAAEKEISLQAGGDIAFESEQAIVTAAFEQSHQARRGDYRVKANDDVRVDGERIKLNSTSELPPRRFQR
jgi:uncharacterized protein (DUF2345 family)